MRNFAPVFIKHKIGTVFAVVASDARGWRRRCCVFTFLRHRGVRGSRAVARFALDVGKVWSGFDVDETFFLKTDRMASDTGIIEGAIFRFESGERV